MPRLVLVTFFLVACGGGAKPEPAAPRSPTAAELGPMCDRYYVRQRTCVTEYLGALIDARAEYDMPPGIAAHVAAVGRDAALAEARVDWEMDTAPDKTTAICKQMAERTPSEHVERLLKDGKACEATADCITFAACAVDTERSYIKSGARH